MTDILTVIRSVNEATKYKNGEYTFNEMMSRIDNSKNFKELTYYADYFYSNKTKYPLIQSEYAHEFIEEKYETLETEILLDLYNNIING